MFNSISSSLLPTEIWLSFRFYIEMFIGRRFEIPVFRIEIRLLNSTGFSTIEYLTQSANLKGRKKWVQRCEFTPYFEDGMEKTNNRGKEKKKGKN